MALLAIGDSIDPAIKYVEGSPQRRRPRVGGDPASFVEKSLDPRRRGDDEITIFNCRINNDPVIPVPRMESPSKGWYPSFRNMLMP